MEASAAVTVAVAAAVAASVAAVAAVTTAGVAAAVTAAVAPVASAPPSAAASIEAAAPAAPAAPATAAAAAASAAAAAAAVAAAAVVFASAAATATAAAAVAAATATSAAAVAAAAVVTVAANEAPAEASPAAIHALRAAPQLATGARIKYRSTPHACHAVVAVTAALTPAAAAAVEASAAVTVAVAAAVAAPVAALAAVTTAGVASLTGVAGGVPACASPRPGASCVITPFSTFASQPSSSSLESATQGVSTEPPVTSPTRRWARSVSALTATTFSGPPRIICSMVGCGGASGLPPIHAISLHSCRRLVSRRSSRCAACTCLRSSFICCVRNHLSRCRRLHPNRYSSDTELPFCLIHLWIPAFASSDLLSRSSLPALPSRSCLTFATSTRSSLIAAASCPVTLRAR